MKKNKIKLYVYRTLGLLFLFLPIVFVFIYNREIYFATAKETVKITIGAFIGLIIAILILMNKAQALKGYGGLLAGFAIVYFLNSIVEDLLVIYFAIIVGDTIYRFGFLPLINKYKEICKYQNEQYVKEEAKGQYQKDLELAREKEQKKKLGSV